ncbi:MAG: Gfo/Idh/MocA family oxidoreductase [Fulvivirga sp.]|nr:Gfo/Idh/MocA family oxidoreductase [Fulvivirga sp.]
MKNSRRHFLVKTATSVAGLSLISPSAIVSACSPGASERKLGIALVGLGYYSTDLLAPALQMTQYCELKGIVTGSPEKIPKWQRKYNIQDEHVYNYGNMHEIAGDDAIDVVYIVLPTGLHSEYAIKAANAGKHVWCEKPMARTVEECRAIIDACNKNKVKLSIGYRMQHEPNTQLIMKWAKTQPYGSIEKVTAAAGYYDGRTEHWKLEKEMGGGALYDMGVYPINAMRYSTAKEPLRVLEARHETNRPELFDEVDETTYFTLEFPDKIIAHGETSFGKSMNRLHIDCQDGWYELSPFQSYSGIRGRTSDGKLLNKSIANQQARQMDDDALAIIHDEPVMVPGEEGLRDIRIVQAIYESAGKKQVIEI